MIGMCVYICIYLYCDVYTDEHAAGTHTHVCMHVKRHTHTYTYIYVFIHFLTTPACLSWDPISTSLYRVQVKMTGVMNGIHQFSETLCLVGGGCQPWLGFAYPVLGMLNYRCPAAHPSLTFCTGGASGWFRGSWFTKVILFTGVYSATGWGTCENRGELLDWKRVLNQLPHTRAHVMSRVMSHVFAVLSSDLKWR